MCNFPAILSEQCLIALYNDAIQVWSCRESKFQAQLEQLNCEPACNVEQLNCEPACYVEQLNCEPACYVLSLMDIMMSLCRASGYIFFMALQDSHRIHGAKAYFRKLRLNAFPKGLGWYRVLSAGEKKF
jgi:hypothetical protein